MVPVTPSFLKTRYSISWVAYTGTDDSILINPDLIPKNITVIKSKQTSKQRF